MSTLMALVLLTTLFGSILMLAIMRYCFWRNRALLIMAVSAAYFMTIFMIFMQYGQVFE